MVRGLCMMRGFLVIARLMVFGGFLVVSRTMRDTCSCVHQENSSTGVPRHLCHFCDKCWNRAQIGVPEADSRQCEGGGNIVDICNAAARWWEAAVHEPFIVTVDVGWRPPGSGGRGLIAMEQKTGLDP